MNRTLRLPLVPVLIAYTLGLYAGYLDLPLPPHRFIFLSWTILLAFWALLMGMKKTEAGSWMALVLFFLLGIFSIHHYLHPPDSPSHISQYIGSDRISLEGVVDRTPHYGQGRIQLWIRSEKIILSNRSMPVEGLLLLILRKETGPFRPGDRLRFLCRLHSPLGFHNPGGFSYERYLAFDRIHTIGFLSHENSWIRIGEGFKHPLLLRIEGWRDRIRNFLEKESPPPSSSIFKALVLGEQGDIAEEVKESFARTGTAHLLAISGDQFGIVAFLSFALLIWILKRSEFLLLSISVRKWAAGLTIPLIVLYAFIAGGGMPVIRAMIMLIAFLFSILLNRERNLLHTLALAAFLILLLSPPSLFDVSFQLSFLAVLSILYMVPRILEGLKEEEITIPLEITWKRRIWKYVKLSLLVTAVATLGTAPFVALHFNRISPIGLVTNLLIIPWVGFVIVPLSLVASILSFFLSPVAIFLIDINHVITLTLLRVLSFFASFPFASFFVSTPTPLEMVLFYFLLFLTVHLKKHWAARYLFVGSCAILVFNLAFWSLKDRFQESLALTFIDVGQGDSVLLEFPGGKTMLIDGGGLPEDRFDLGKNVIAPFLWKKKIRRIDYLVLTHPDPDHLKGLRFIASHFSIGQFWDNGVRTNSEAYQELENTLSRKRIERLHLNENSPPKEIHGVRISFLNPPERSLSNAIFPVSSFLNNSSLGIMIQFGNIGVLLLGDIEKEGEYRLLREEVPLRADILKIPHHGSLSSSTTRFLQSVSPSFAVLSAGKRNIGGLPHPEVIKRYQDLGTTLYRTDHHGAITIRTDGEKIEIRTFLKGNS